MRLFAALTLPTHIRSMLKAQQRGLPGAHWRPTQSLHITLRFFGELPEDTASRLRKELAGIESSVLELRLQGVAQLASTGDFDALCVGVSPEPLLGELKERCEGVARCCGLAGDERPYRPHVTIAYVSRLHSSSLRRWIRAKQELTSSPFSVESFGLFSSWRTPSDAQYRLERGYTLGAAPSADGGA